jgi:hypothetical protein
MEYKLLYYKNQFDDKAGETWSGCLKQPCAQVGD